ncbi:uncharacterized protein LOC115875357 [Sitophilus oryzae]|uniref:Uncharacterized protein LOC115875357 n=1 Tax=Sitophilus oryzae TaxID=7048 RepID=A0A6J2X6K8_SITOR|nr:uncharacterized protein LOC115875357 [Sitophilus oryzae]
MRGSTAGFPDNFQGDGTTYYTLITVLDLLFSAVIVCPCVVSYWRSVWTLMDIYVAPNNKLLSAAISTSIGICGHLFFLLFQKVLENNFHPDKNRILFYLVSRLYTVCFAFTCVNGWRGPWDILTIHTQTDFKSLMVTTAVGLVALISMRALRNVSSPPCVIVNDSVKGYFEVLTMFRVTVKEKVSLLILDCLFSVLVVGTLVVFVWRGLWIMVDLFLFPEDRVASAHGSLVLGYSIIAVVYLLQPLIRSICTKLSGASRLLFADLFIIFSLVGTINVWRGIWMMLDIYFLPDDVALSCWITLVISLTLLILLGCANSLLVRGVYIDAEEPNGKCVVLPCYYLRLIFQAEKLKKINKKMRMAEKVEKYEVIDNNHVVTINTISSVVEENSKRDMCHLQRL